VSQRQRIERARSPERARSLFFRALHARRIVARIRSEHALAAAGVLLDGPAPQARAPGGSRAARAIWKALPARAGEAMALLEAIDVRWRGVVATAL
jgi:hypothetical protein